MRAEAAEVAAARNSGTPWRWRNQRNSCGARTGRVKAALPSRRKEIRVSEIRISVSDEPRVSTSFMKAA